jgi:hypothetical protein
MQDFLKVLSRRCFSLGKIGFKIVLGEEDWRSAAGAETGQRGASPKKGRVNMFLDTLNVFLEVLPVSFFSNVEAKIDQRAKKE